MTNLAVLYFGFKIQANVNRWCSRQILLYFIFASRSWPMLTGDVQDKFGCTLFWILRSWPMLTGGVQDEFGCTLFWI